MGNEASQRGKGAVMGILLVFFGVLAIVGGIYGKNFHIADVIALGEFKQESSKWSGRLVLTAVGGGLVGVGIMPSRMAKSRMEPNTSNGSGAMTTAARRK